VKKSAVIMLIVLILLLIPSGFVNLTRGVHMGDYFYTGDRFYMPRDNKNDSWTYRAADGYSVLLDWSGDGTFCSVNAGNTNCDVQLDWKGDQARLEFDDGTVLEGRWTGKDLIDKDGRPLWMNDDESMIHIIVGDEPEPPLRKYTIACGLCRMDRKELEPFGSGWMLLLGAVIYVLGMLNILYPEQMYFLGNRWRYRNAELSDAGYMMQFFGGIVLLILGVIVLFLPLFV